MQAIFELLNKIKWKEKDKEKNIVIPEVKTEKDIQELKNLYREYVLYGGYPKVVLAPEIELKEKYLQQIVDTYVKRDIRDLARVRDVDKFNKLVETLAAQSGQLLNVVELSNVCRISMPTVEKYLFILENTYVIKLVRPFFTNMRSELFKMPKIFFYDSGLAQMLWLKRLQKEIIGSAFETSVFGELVKKYGGENVFYWRTKMMQEIDFVLKTTTGMIPIEAKVNFENFKQGGIRNFMEKYKSPRYAVAGLHGERSRIEYLYPWEL